MKPLVSPLLCLFALASSACASDSVGRMNDKPQLDPGPPQSQADKDLEPPKNDAPPQQTKRPSPPTWQGEASITIAPLSDDAESPPTHTETFERFSVFRDSTGFSTTLDANQKDALVPSLHLTIVQLDGAGEYPVGFAWSRGDTRAVVMLQQGLRCMTPGLKGDRVTISRAPEGAGFEEGEQLAGTFEFTCLPDANGPREQGLRIEGSFVVERVAPR